ncbi:MAG TPA: FecR domain-containing protein [Planctomycetota bacterium]|nr:FecR domain-containing protein [Planctomycetota bacterium]
MTAMDESCRRFREELAALRHGEESSVDAAELREHLAGCPECRRAEDQAALVAELLRACQPPLPPGGFDRLSAAVAALAEESRGGEARPAGRKPALPLGVFVAVAAAAAVLIAFWIGFGLSGGRDGGGREHARPVARVLDARGASGLSDDGTVVPGQSLGTGPGGSLSLRTERGARLELAGDGLIKILAPDVVELTRGCLVAAVEKGADPFRVVTPDAEVRTLGTRFSVRIDSSGTQVTVIDGRVLFRGSSGAGIEVAAGQTAQVAAGGAAPGMPRAASPGDLGQLLPVPAPAVDMSLTAVRSEAAPGAALSARLELVNRSGGVLTLENSARPMPSFFLKVADAAGRSSFACPLITAVTVDGRPADQGTIVMQPDSVCRLELDLGTPLESPGEYRLAVIFFGSLRSGAGAWSGSLESRTATVRIKAQEAPRGAAPGTSRGEARR